MKNIGVVVAIVLLVFFSAIACAQDDIYGPSGDIIGMIVPGDSAVDVINADISKGSNGDYVFGWSCLAIHGPEGCADQPGTTANRKKHERKAQKLKERINALEQQNQFLWLILFPSLFR